MLLSGLMFEKVADSHPGGFLAHPSVPYMGNMRNISNSITYASNIDFTLLCVSWEPLVGKFLWEVVKNVPTMQSYSANGSVLATSPCPNVPEDVPRKPTRHLLFEDLFGDALAHRKLLKQGLLFSNFASRLHWIRKPSDCMSMVATWLLVQVVPGEQVSAPASWPS